MKRCPKCRRDYYDDSLPFCLDVRLTEEKSRLDAQLANDNFARHAPAEKVEALRDRAAELEGQIATMNTNLEALGN